MLVTVDITKFDSPKKLIAYIVTDPIIKESGSSVGGSKGIIKRGNKALRRKIYYIGCIVSRCNEKFKEYYEKKRNQGTNFKSSIVAVVNKLIKIIYYLFKKKVNFSTEYS